MKPCPFCGREHPVLTMMGDSWFYQCIRCRAEGPHTVKSEHKAEELWERRYVGP